MGRLHLRSRRGAAAVATSVLVIAALLTAPSAVADPPPPEAYDNFNGTGNADGSATEYGSRTWQALNGAWTRTGSGTVSTGAATTANPMLVTDMGSGDVDARLTTTGSSGEALYVRVQDASNWVRARVRHTQSQQYFTDREFSTTHKQWEVNYNRTETQWQDRVFERQYSRTVYGSWSAWSTYGTSACQSSAGEVSLPADTDTTQYRTANGRTSGCSGGKKKWDKQSRTRSKSVDTIWQNAEQPAPSGYTATGNTRTVDSGSPYWGDRHRVAPGMFVVQVGTRTVLDHTGWQDTSAVSAPDALTGSTRTLTELFWWTLAQQTSTGYTDPCAWWRATNSSYTNPTCSLTGQTRQGAVTATTDQYHLILSKSVAGNITQLGIWSVGTSALPGFRVTTTGSTITVYAGTGTGSQVGTVTDGAFANQTRHGCGLGGSDTTSPTNALTYCYLEVANSAPSQPTGLRATPGGDGYTTSAVPTLTATSRDPDGDPVTITFAVLDGTGTTVWSGSSQTAPDGSASVDVPPMTLALGARYSVTAIASDGPRQSAISQIPLETDVGGTTPVSGCLSPCQPVVPTILLYSSSGSRIPAGESRTVRLLDTMTTADDVGILTLRVTAAAGNSPGVVRVWNADFPKPVAPTLTLSSSAATQPSSAVVAVTPAVDNTLVVTNDTTGPLTVTLEAIGRYDWYNADEDAVEDAVLNPTDDVDEGASESEAPQADDSVVLTSQEKLAANASGALDDQQLASGPSGNDACVPMDDGVRDLCVATLSASDYSAEVSQTWGLLSDGQRAGYGSDPTADAAARIASDVCLARRAWQDLNRYTTCRTRPVRWKIVDKRTGEVLAKALTTVNEKETVSKSSLSMTRAIKIHFDVGYGGFVDGFGGEVFTECTECVNRPDHAAWTFGIGPGYRDAPITIQETAETPASGGWTSPTHSLVFSLPGAEKKAISTAPTLRCDNATYLWGHVGLQYTAGCVIKGFVPTFYMSLTGKAPETAGHVLASITDGQPSTLQRWFYGGSGRNPNRKSALAICSYYRKYGDPPLRGSCDEYAFASTEQGCYVMHCSVKGIDLADNKMGGSLLGSFFKRERVYGGIGNELKPGQARLGDYFRVRIIP